ncbi:MAG: protecting protein DprA, partial [Fibrobacteria bacterium]|nr:protecting protein DprA [Fibrobacteria bacterium]
MISPENDDFPWYACLATQHFLGPVGFKALIEGCGSARAVYALSEAGLRALHPTLRPEMLESLAKGPDFRAWEEVARVCERRGITVTVPTGPEFPRVLREGPDAAPPILFLRGAWRPEDARAVALVGTRAPTDDGRRAAFMLGNDLGAAGFTVVSGLAVGVDAEAHAGALHAGGRTLAVIGCGLDIDYPPANRELRARIESEDRGAVISEHPPGTLPKQMYFPRRNRLISALSRAIVVVEAGEKSGALITADQARRQNKVLFAAPGSPFNPQARGNHTLLRAGAALAASAEDIVAVLEGAPDERARRARPVQPALPQSKAAASAKKTARAAKVPAKIPEVPPADPVLRLWSGDEACGLDALAARAVAGNLWP